MSEKNFVIETGLTIAGGGNVDGVTNLTATGNITANYYVGDGSQLTGISSSGAFIANGTSNVDIATANGNITITANSDQTWTFDSTGNVSIPGSIVGLTANNPGSLVWEQDGSGLNYLKLIPDNSLISTDQYLVIDPYVTGHIHIRAGGPQDNSNAYLFLGGDDVHVEIDDIQKEVTIKTLDDANSTAYQFTFTNVGSFTSPGNITASQYFIGNGSQLTGVTGNIGFIGETIYDLNGVIIENSDLSHGATAAVILPVNGDTDPIQVNNTYGNVTLQAGDTAVLTGSWTFNNQGTIVAPYPNANTFPLPLSSAYYVPTVGKPALNLTGDPWQFTGSFAYSPNGEVTILLDNIFPTLTNPGYDSGDTFEFGASVTGVGGYTLSLALANVVQAGPAGWTANPQVSQPFAYPSTVESSGAVKITSDVSDWTFGTTGDLVFPDGTVFGGNNVTVVTGSDFSITTSSLTSVSADCYIGLPDEFVADTEFNDDITVVRAGWTVVVDGTAYTVTYIDPAPPANQYRITVDGATFVSGTNYTFTDPVAVSQSWSIDQYGTMTAPGGSRIATDASAFEIQNANAINFEAINTVNIYTDTANAGYQWQFGDDGNIILPSNNASINYANGQPYGSGSGSSGYNYQYEVTEFVANTAPGFGEIQFADFEGGNSAPATAQKLFINEAALNEQVLGTILQQWTQNTYRGTLSLNNGSDQATFNISNGSVYFEPEQYRGFSAGLNQIWGDDPSINQLIITNATAPKFYNTDFLLEDDVFHATDLYTGNTHVMLNVYGSDQNKPINPNDLWNVFTSFVDNILYDGETLRTDPGDIKIQFYNNTGSFRNNIPTQDLYQYFRFVNNTYFNAAPTTGGSGTDATVRIRLNANNTYAVLGVATAGIGYIGGENLVVAGTDLGGATPANDLTLLIDSVDGDGRITAVSYLNGDALYPWPSNYISDGGSDQYDGGNYLNTDLAAEISYGNGDTQITSADFGGGDYCVMYDQSFFCMVATGANISDLFYSGNLGSDGDGLLRWTGLRSSQAIAANNFAQYAYFDSKYLDSTLAITNGVTYNMTLDSAGIDLDEYYAYYNDATNDYYFGSNNDWRLESQNNLYVQSYNDMFIQTVVNERGTNETGPNINIEAGRGSPGQAEINAQAGGGGTVNVRGGGAGDSDELNSLGNNGGDVVIEGGEASGNSTGGSVYIRGGITENGSGGNVAITTYNGPVGNGRVTITTTDGTERVWAFNPNGTTIFPSLTTQRGDTTSSTITGYTLNGGDGYQEFVITTPNGDPATTGSSAQRIVINPGAGNVDTSGEGGDIYLWAGRGGEQGGSGGDVKIRGGQGMGTGGAGGYIRMEAGDGYSDAGSPGYIEITGGQGGTSQPGGYIEITGGQGDLNGGNANILGGTSISGTGGVVNITGGVSGLGLADYGNVNISAGASTWRFDNAGNLTLPSNTFAVNYANGTQVSIGGGGPVNTGNVTFSDNIVFGTGDEFGGAGLYLAPGPASITSVAGNVQYLRVRGGDYPTHIHLDTGNVQYYDQYFGDDNKYVKLEAGYTGNIVIGTDDDNGNRYTWTHDSTGNLTIPGNIKSVTTGFTFTSNITGVDTTTTPGNVYIELADDVFGGPETGRVTITDVVGTTEANGTWYFEAAEVNYIQLFYDAALQFPVDGTGWPAYVSGGLAVAAGYNNLSITGGNVSIINNIGNTWTFDNTGNLTTPSNLVIGPGPGSGSSILQYNDTLQIVGEGANAAIIMGWAANQSAPDSVATIAMNFPSIGEGNVLIAVGNNATTVNYWNFDSTGNLTAPGNVVANTFVSNAFNVLTAGNLSITSQYGLGFTGTILEQGGTLELLANGTGGCVIVGWDSSYGNGLGNIATVSLNEVGGGEGNVLVRTGNRSATEYNWNFDKTGNLTLPGNTFAVNYANGTPVSLGSGGTGSNIVNGNSNVDIATANGNITVVSGGTSTWTFDTTGNLTIPSNSGGLIKTAANGAIGITAINGGSDNPAQMMSWTVGQTNPSTIISTYANSATVMTDVNGTIKTWSFDNAGNLTLPGNTFAVNYANGIAVSLGGSSYGNANVVANLAALSSNPVSTTGNVTSGNLITSANVNITANAGQINFNTGAYISGNANSISRDGSIVLSPYTGAGSTFPGVVVGGAGRLIAPNGGVFQIFNASDVTFQVATKVTVGTAATTPVAAAVIVTGGIGASGTATTGVGALLTGPTFTPLANTLVGFNSNVNSYVQATLQNKSTGADATADFILTADNGSDTVNYGDFGIINSGYDNATPTNSLGNIVFAADTYLYAQGNTGNASQSGGNLVIGTTVPGKTVKIFAGGVTNSNIVANISNTGVSVTGNVTASNFIGNISITGNVTGTSPNVSLVAGSYTYTFDNTGILTLPAPSTGNEGGEIAFTQAANSTLAGNTVVMDQYVDRFRFFESGGNTRGAYIDFTQAADGVGTLLNNRVSGLVNAGTFVTMDLLKATVTTSGNRGLSLAATTGSFSILIGGNYSTSGGANGSSGSGTINTTPSASQFGWNFLSAGDTATYIITDTTNSRTYRITMQIGASFNNNLISIERLV